MLIDPIYIDYNLKIVDIISSKAVDEVYTQEYIKFIKEKVKESIPRNYSRGYYTQLDHIRKNIDREHGLTIIIQSITVATFIGDVIRSDGGEIQFKYVDLDGKDAYSEGLQIWIS